MAMVILKHCQLRLAKQWMDIKACVLQKKLWERQPHLGDACPQFLMGPWISPMVSPANMNDCGPEWLSPAAIGPIGYGFEHPMAVSPAAMGPHGYGFEHPMAVSPAAMGPAWLWN